MVGDNRVILSLYDGYHVLMVGPKCFAVQCHSEFRKAEDAIHYPLRPGQRDPIFDLLGTLLKKREAGVFVRS
jgi:hypothetical protein